MCELARTFPVVTIEGPRQSGKTTLAKMAFPEYTYANLEDTATRKLAETDPRGFLAKFRAPAIIDEIQRVPSLLSDIQVEVDKKGGSGLYVLTGSHQPRLKAGVSQTLAGRTALVTLLPLSIEELNGVGIELSRDEYILRGFLPAIYDRGQNPVDAYEAYYRTYVERDVRQLVNITHQGEFELFLRLLAGRVGQVVNLEAMSGDVGVSSTTLKEWLSVLEASFVVFRVAPYYNNFGKRFVKSPKVYFTDVGLAAHLLDLSSAEQVSRDPLLGGLFENMVMAEALKARYNAGRDGRIYYMRDKVGCEIDLVVENQRRLTFIEIKSAQTPNDGMAANIRVLRKSTGAGEKAYVVYSGESWPLRDGDGFVNFRETATLV
ncbi:MAG: ATP-binding protein [bacterium]|nr:ATP-binding protein [bacterium]